MPVLCRCYVVASQPSPRRLPAKLRAKIAALMTTTYTGFNDVHLTEKLREVHALEVCLPPPDSLGVERASGRRHSRRSNGG